MAPVILGYWKIRGLAQSIRLLFGYTKTDFEDKLYECGDAPTYDKSCWLDVKEKLGLDFPNLPYYIEGDIKLTQSNAIIRRIARKHKMEGQTEEEKTRVDLIENCAMDWSNAYARLAYFTRPEDLEAKSEEYKKNTAVTLKRFDNFIGGRTFFAGDKLTFVDFIMYELIDEHILFQADILEPFANLKGFMKRFEEIPEIAEFMKSDKCFKGPINNKIALFK